MKTPIFMLFMFFMLLISSYAHALTIASINAEWFWDSYPPHEGEVIGTGYKNKKPPSKKEFALKAYAIALHIQAVNADIVGLIEIENKAVAKKVVRYLGHDWKVIFIQGRDTFSGQDVALITRLQAIEGTATTFPNYKGQSQTGRVKKTPTKVLGVALKHEDKTFYVVVTHLISKNIKNDKKRFAQADAIRKAVVAQYGKYDHYVVMGDMNDLPGSPVLERLKGKWDGEPDLVQPADLNGDDADFSYMYFRKKQLIDHILVDRSLAKGANFYSVKLSPIISDHRMIVFEK